MAIDLEQAQKLAELNEMTKNQPMQSEPDYFEGEYHRFHKFLIENGPQVEAVNGTFGDFWAFMDKEMAISNLDKEDIKRGLMWFDIAKIDVMMGKPDFEMDFLQIRNIDEARFKALVKMKRSFGTDRERVMLATSIKEIRTNEKQQGGGGIPILGRFFGGKK